MGIVTRNAVTIIKLSRKVSGRGKRLLPSHTPPCFSVSHSSNARLLTCSSDKLKSGLSNYQAMYFSSFLLQAGQYSVNQRSNLRITCILRHLWRNRTFALAIRRILGTPLDVINGLAFCVLLTPQIVEAGHDGIRLY